LGRQGLACQQKQAKQNVDTDIRESLEPFFTHPCFLNAEFPRRRQKRHRGERARHFWKCVARSESNITA